MEQNKPKFRLRLNLFDTIVLVIALIAAGFMAWMALNPPPASGDDADDCIVRYTIRLQRWVEGNSKLIQLGDKRLDNGQNADLGQIVDIQVVPAEMTALNEAARRYVQAELEGYEDILVTLEVPAKVGKSNIMANGKYVLRVGAMVYLRGEGYMGSGPIVALEETDLPVPEKTEVEK